MKQLVIICGGKGTRLKKSYPKILVKINKKTILEYQIELAKKHGFKKFVLLTGYKSKMIKEFVKIKKISRNLKIIDEKRKLGTGGALLNSLKYLDKEFCVIFGDIFTKINLSKMKLFFKKNICNSLMVINKNKNYEDSNLVSIINKIYVDKFYFYPHKKIPRNCYSNEAIFMFKKLTFKYLNILNIGNQPDLVKNILPLIHNIKKINAYKTGEFIIDCGTDYRLKTARSLFKKN